MALHRKALDVPFSQMSRKLGLPPRKVAEGIIQVANANMEKARGMTPRIFPFVFLGEREAFTGRTLLVHSKSQG